MIDTKITNDNALWIWAVKDNYEEETETEINFKVTKEWAEKWFKEKRLNQETNGNIKNDRYETLEDWLNDYILDDSIEMFNCAKNEDVVLEIEELDKPTIK